MCDLFHFESRFEILLKVQDLQLSHNIISENKR